MDLPLVRYEVEIYCDIANRSPFEDWMKNVAPTDERRIRKRILRIENGNLGDHKAVGGGVHELRFFSAPAIESISDLMGRLSFCCYAAATNLHRLRISKQQNKFGKR